MKHRIDLKETMLFLLRTFIVLAVLLGFGSDVLMTENRFFSTQLDEGWSVCYGENQAENVTLSDFDFVDVHAGDVVTISNRIEDRKVVSPTIMFCTYNSASDVTIDGSPVYSFGHEYTDNGRYVPQKYNIITFDNTENEHTVEITFTAAENMRRRKLPAIYYGNRGELIRGFFQRKRLPVFAGGFMGMYACLLLCLAPYLFLHHGKDLSLFYSAAIAALLAFYIYASNDIFCFICDRDYLISLGEYLSLYLIPLAISVLLYSIHPDIANKRQKLLLGVNIVFPVIAIVLHILNVFPVNRFASVFQVITAFEVLLLMPPLLKGVLQLHDQKLESPAYAGVDADSYLLRAFIVLFIFAILEVIKHNIVRYGHIVPALIKNFSFITIGSLFFVVCLFIYYFYSGIEYTNATYIKKHLEGLAYTDALTSLMNRAKCMQYMSTLAGHYAIVSLDLDRLKFVNDTFGHTEGDRMIKAFADILKKAFESAALIGRTGGDEFVAVYEKPSEGRCEQEMQKLQDLMASYNEQGEKFTLSASAGCAYSSEVDGGMEEVYYLADTRMYEMKEKHHE